MRAQEKTLIMIKPNAMKKNVIGNIIGRFEKAGLTVVAAQMKHLTRDEAGLFYLEHKDRPFYTELVGFMTSAPVMILAFQGEDAVKKARDLMGATNPAQAELGTIRKEFGDSVGENAIHGSDSTASAQREVRFFFDSTF
jgi:nucleoside-diphosphate kinase